MKALKFLFIASAAVLIAGCKLEIVAVQGGDVAWSGGSCSEGSNCVVEITDPNFSNSFTVTPKPGYEFVKWQKGAGTLCGDSTSLTCTFTMPDDDSQAASIIGVFATGYIMPVYKDVGIDTDSDTVRNELDDDDDNDGLEDTSDNCPLVAPNGDGFGCPILDTDGDGLNDDVDPCPANPTNPCALITSADIVTADGKEWAQAVLFTNLSWSQINAVCPAGVCIDGSILNGRDMTGWRWASLSEVAALFNSYGVNPPLVGITITSEVDSAWAPDFFRSGWRSTWIDPLHDMVGGIVRDEFANFYGRFAGLVDWYDPLMLDGAWTHGQVTFEYSSPNYGAFIFR